MSETFKEFAIEVVDRGYIDSWTGNISDDPDQMHTIEKIDDALGSAESARRRYCNMGCPDIADTIRVVTRTVEVIRGEWTPIP